MIAMLLGLIVVGTTLGIYVSTVSSSAGVIRTSRLNYDLDSVLVLMINDIKRAGYWGGAILNSDSRDNPFTDTDTDVQIIGTNCILYSYDANNDGTVQDNELYGFRFENSSIEMRKTGENTSDCDNSDDEWEEFIDGNQLDINSLQFSFAPLTNLPGTSSCLNSSTNPATITNAINCTGANTGDNLLQKRIINIRINGQLDTEPSVTKTVMATVEIRNNRVFQSP